MTSPVINIVSAEQVADFRLLLRFDDGVDQIVDFYQFLSNSRHPSIRLWLDPARFATFRLEYGELVWGDYELCFPIMDLYYNRINHHGLMESVA